MQISLVLYNIRSAHNVGSILRTADGAGASRVYLVGTTPTPTDRFGRPRADIAKVALDAERSVPWEHIDDAGALLTRLRKEGVRIVALEQDERSVPYTQLTLGEPTAILLGEEVKGIPHSILDVCDCVVEIPMHGKKESLNVSVAAGVLLFSLASSRALRSTKLA